MGQGISKRDLEGLCDAKLQDALLLLRNGRWGNAYYLAGYAVELGLKACIASQFPPQTIPDKRFVNSVHTHKFADLIGLARMTADLRARQDIDSLFAANWGIAAEWTSDARYDSADQSSADFLLNAIIDRAHGVLPWIKTYW